MRNIHTNFTAIFRWLLGAVEAFSQ